MAVEQVQVIAGIGSTGGTSQYGAVRFDIYYFDFIKLRVASKSHKLILQILFTEIITKHTHQPYSQIH